MTGQISRIWSIGMVAFALVACLVLAAPAVAGKKGGGKINITKTVNAPIPDKAPFVGGAEGRDGHLVSTIDVGKQFKGKVIRDVNVTVQTLGTSGMTPASDLEARIVSPNGANSYLFFFLGGFGTINRSIGPLTLDDEAALDVGQGPPNNSTMLYMPWVGTAAPQGGQLWPLDYGPVRGTWTLDMFDTFNNGTSSTSNLVSWHLNVVAGKPFQPK